MGYDLEYGEARETPAHPVWTPVPGVPLVARILAYSFAALLALTVALSLFNERPSDAAPYPEKWLSYTSKHGWSTGYPQGWYAGEESRLSDDGEAIALWPGSWIRVEFLTLSDEIPPDAIIDREELRKAIGEKVQEIFDGYAQPAERPQYADATQWTLFTFGEEKHSMAGAWRIHAEGRHCVVLIALAPLESWPTLERLLTPLDSYFTFGPPTGQVR